ncbi:MAG TPA: alternative ribosome rescue aminoacyl-tRNA hydrolase ArfB [Rhizomicrobium sp.]|nr:alternative ribosome rescue aminoacyl-tRNA hydrolase ArfB [Rhizomicrobium sp.]
MKDLIVNRVITIADHELEERFIRSSGPGGQNVNKVSSAVQLRFDVRNSASLTETARSALLGAPSVTRDGVLVITAQRFREQEKNRADARARLVEIIRRAATPKKARRPTKVPKASRRKRLEGKKHRAEIKRGRAKLD